jgi:error-prone DNA polymerase
MVVDRGGALIARFAHLHARSGFSYGFGTATPEELAEASAEMGMVSLALTDRDGLYGIPGLLKAAKVSGISPIVGAEVTMEGGGHLVLLAESVDGYGSLSRLITAYRCASEDRRRPRCPLDLLLNHARGLICLSGAVPFGLIPSLVLSDRASEAREILGRLSDAFGQEGVFVELTDDRTAGSRTRLRKMVLFAEENRAPVLATNEVAYLRRREHRLHDVLVAASNLTKLPGPGYRPTDQLYLKPAAKMESLFADYPEALKNAAMLADRCAGAVELAGRVHVPTAMIGDDAAPEGELTRLSLAGAKERYGKLDEKVLGRLRRELSCIQALGFAPYFLLAHEAVRIAKGKGVPVTGRGSAANSVVSYCLGLTQPEPFANRLLFERFLHEGREDPPDVDLDLCSEGRDEVRDELLGRYERYGAAVAATANTLSLRGAVRVAARALGHPPEETNRLSRYVPVRFKDRDRFLNPISGWNEALSEPAMRGHPLQDKRRHELLLDLSWRLAGRLHQAGTHLGGLIFGNARNHLSELVPLEPSGKPGLIRCQFDKDDLEYVGLPKLDLLGLKMHTALKKAGELVSRRSGEEIDPLYLPPDDAETYRLIRTGRNAGMFQLESPGQMHLSRRLGPRRFSDLIAQISLFRPGPVRGDLVTPYVMRRKGLEEYSVPLQELEEVLGPTYGILMYQEQVLEVAHKVAGFSLAEGDLIRRAMTKDRGHGAMGAIKGEFVRRAVGRGVPIKTAREIFSWVEGFSVYGFPASHAASFAHLSYASAYMRRHYPAEFFGALLNSQPMGFYSPRVLLNEARRIGISVLPTDIHLSAEGFTAEADGTALRVGLSYCKGISQKAVASILSEKLSRPFASVSDLYQRTHVEKDCLEMLVRGGFLDTLSDRKEDRLGLLDEAQRLPKKRRHARQPEIPMPHPASWWATRECRTVEHLPLTETRRERMEWDTLGLNVRRHPLSPYHGALSDLEVVSSKAIMDLPHGARARTAGLIECLQCPPTKSGNPVWFLLIEDEYGLLQATIFRDVYAKYGDLLHHRGAFLLEGRVEQGRRRGFSFLVERVADLVEVLAETRMSAPKATTASGTLLRAKMHSRRVG